MWKHSSLNLLHKNYVTILRIKQSIISEIVLHRTGLLCTVSSAYNYTISFPKEEKLAEFKYVTNIATHILKFLMHSARTFLHHVSIREDHDYVQC